MILINQENTWD